MSVIGLVSPGSMGSAIAACAQSKGHEIIWASDGRSPRTVGNAVRHGFTDVENLLDVADRADVVLVVGAGWGDWQNEVAHVICVEGSFEGTYVDANSLPEAETDAIQEIVHSGGATFVEGVLLGSPPVDPQMSIRGYLNGPGAQEFADLFNNPDIPAMLDANVIGTHDRAGYLATAETPRRQRGYLGRADLFEWVVMDGSPGVLKMLFTAYSAATHGAVVMANRAARAYGVEDELFYELTNGFPVDPTQDGSIRGLFAGW